MDQSTSRTLGAVDPASTILSMGERCVDDRMRRTRLCGGDVYTRGWSAVSHYIFQRCCNLSQSWREWQHRARSLGAPSRSRNGDVTFLEVAGNLTASQLPRSPAR